MVTRLGQPSIQASARRTRLLSAFSGSAVQVCGTTEALKGLMPLNSSSPIAFLAQADLNGRAGHFSAISGFSGSAVQMNGTAETLNELMPLINSAHRLLDTDAPARGGWLLRCIQRFQWVSGSAEPEPLNRWED